MTTTPRPTTALHLRELTDLIAVAPVLLGFWPEQSVMLMTFGARDPFHVRVDLPRLPAQRPDLRRELGEVLVEPAVRHGASHVALLYYTDDPAEAEATHRWLRRAARRVGLVVMAALHVESAHFRDLHHRDPAVRTRRRPYDVSAHPLVLEAQLSGRPIHRSRADLAASLDPDPAAVAAVSSALVAGRYADAGIPTNGRALRDAGEWVQHAVHDLVVDETLPGDDDLAHLLWVMQAGRVRDAAWSAIDRPTSAAHLRLWTDAVRRAPDPLSAAPAALLAWSAWQAGDGALAWIAVDRSQRAHPGYVMADQLATLLRGAVPPSYWVPGFAWDEGLPDASGDG